MREWKVVNISLVEYKSLENELNQLEHDGWSVFQLIQINPSSLSIVAYRNVTIDLSEKYIYETVNSDLEGVEITLEELNE